MQTIGIIGSGSWATAIAKILTDKQIKINWWVRKAENIAFMQKKKHNPHYLHTAYFDTSLIHFTNEVQQLVEQSNIIVIALPSAYIQQSLSVLPSNAFANKQIISAVKGIIPHTFQLVHEYLHENFNIELANYFTLLGPCHAEEVAAEKLSYLTISGHDTQQTTTIAQLFKNDQINTIVNTDVVGAQYASVLKNVYAIGAGMAHGLEYGDNFLSVYIANAALEMQHFLTTCNAYYKQHIHPNYMHSVYLGDLLVTCYSLYSRNRTFGNMIGKGYSVQAAQLEMNMVAEGYNASKCIYQLNQSIAAKIPIATSIYNILWNKESAQQQFTQIEQLLQ